MILPGMAPSPDMRPPHRPNFEQFIGSMLTMLGIGDFAYRKLITHSLPVSEGILIAGMVALGTATLIHSFGSRRR